MEGADVVMTAFKPSDDRLVVDGDPGDGRAGGGRGKGSSPERLIVRFFEPTGRAGEVRPKFAPELTVDPRGRACDLCEEPISPEGSAFAVSAWEIATVAFRREAGR